MELYPEKHFEVLIKILKIGGSWPERNLSRCRFVVAFFVHFLLLDLPGALILIKLLGSDGLEDISEAVNMLLTYFMVFAKSINLMWNMNRVTKLFKTIGGLMDLVKIEDKMRFASQVLRSQKIFKFYYAVALVSVATSVLQPFFTGKLAVKMWFPYDAEANIISLYPTALFQMFSSIHNCSLCIALDMLPIFFMSYVAMFIEILCDDLEEIGRGETSNKTLVKCVEIQIKIKKIIVNIEEIFSGVLMAQGIMSVVILCTTSFIMTVVSNRGLIIKIYKSSMLLQIQETAAVGFQLSFLIPMVCEIFFPCLFGSEIVAASEKISTSLLHSQWLKNSEALQGDLKIMMEYSKRPMKLSTAGVFHINLENFMRILNSAYSLFAVFKKVNAKIG